MKSFFYSLIALFGAMILGTTMTSCDKDPEIIKETITIRDTIIVVDTFTVVETIFQSIPDTATTFILVRHAETTGSGSNPNLSATGQARANELSRILSQINLNSVYATNYNRTMQTAQPVATAKSLPIVLYDNLTSAALIDNVLHVYPKGIVLVVGHSNTTASMLNAMVGSSAYADLPESEYDNLFIVHVSKRGDATVIHLKYGM